MKEIPEGRELPDPNFWTPDVLASYWQWIDPGDSQDEKPDPLPDKIEE